MQGVANDTSQPAPRPSGFLPPRERRLCKGFRERIRMLVNNEDPVKAVAWPIPRD